jgi:hypothetical protein
MALIVALPSSANPDPIAAPSSAVHRKVPLSMTMRSIVASPVPRVPGPDAGNLE